jgi:hypothetical protein
VPALHDKTPGSMAAPSPGPRERRSSTRTIAKLLQGIYDVSLGKIDRVGMIASSTRAHSTSGGT